MNRLHRTAFAAIAAIAALVAVPGAAAASTWRPARITATSNLASYTSYTEMRMRAARTRIVTNVSATRDQARRANMLRDVDVGIGLIRYRVAMYGQDGRITAFESGQVHALAKAIATDLTRTYGPVDSWMLL